MPLRFIKYFACTVSLFLFSGFLSSAQDTTFRSPLDIPLKLSGNFCEIRTDHFHSGIDIKTNGITGLPVYSVAEGYIYRIKVSATGYGKAIYIKHAGNLLTVYAHLSSFSGAIADSVEVEQYKRQSFELEFYPDSNSFPVSKGMLIAYSGNSGGSEAPHLHFEIRDQLSEEPLNPLTGGWHIDDSIPPVIHSVCFYTADSTSFKPVKIISGITNGDSLVFQESVLSIAVNADDIMNDSSPSFLGIEELIVIQDNDTVYDLQMDRLNFSETRYVNAHIDYKLKDSLRVTFQRCFKLPGNNYGGMKIKGSGFILPDIFKFQRLVIIAKDVNQNQCQLTLFIKGSIPSVTAKTLNNNFSFPNKKILKKWKEGSVEFPERAFYESMDTLIFVKERRKKDVIIGVGPAGIISHKPYTIVFTIPTRLYPLRRKLYIAALDKRNNPVFSIGGKADEKTIRADYRKAGRFMVCVDTVPPAIEVLISSSDSLAAADRLYIKIKDRESGITTYSCKINDKWFLFEYDSKSGELSAPLDKLPEAFNLCVQVQDACGNKGELEQYYQRK